MTSGEKYLKQYTEKIETEYLKIVRRGEEDPAIYLDVRNQEGRQQDLAEQRGGMEGSPPLVGIVVAKNRRAIAEGLDKLFPGNEVSRTLSNETPPKGLFPVVVATNEDPGRTEIALCYLIKPDHT